MKTTLKYFVALGALASALFAPPMTLEQRVAETEDRLDEIEFQSGLDKIKFGLDFSTGVSDSTFKIGERIGTGTDGNPTQIAEDKYKAHNKWSMELNLNMNANINSYTKFYGRLSMAKNFAMLDPTYASHPYDYEAGRHLGSSGQMLYVTRAYVDLFFSPEIVATIGRQPGTDGPGSNLRNNAKRQGTYPALIVNTLGDAVVLSYKPNFAKRVQFAVRGAYGKVYQQNNDSALVKDFLDKDNRADSDLYYASFEIQPHLGVLGRSNLFMVSWARLHDLALDMPASAPVSGVQTLGTIDSINVHFESFEAFRLPLNYFVSGSYMKGSKAKGLGAQPLTAVNPAADPNKKLFNEESAYAIHAGLRYDFHRLFKLGGEYFYGSQYWFAMSNSSFNDPFNIRVTRGQAYDVYIISQIDRNQFFRLSYTHIKNKWTNRNAPLAGALSKDDVGGYDSTADSVMFIYNVKF